jgi:hypothetical protein
MLSKSLATTNSSVQVTADSIDPRYVTFTGTIDLPPDTGKVVAAQWDFEGVGTYPVTAPLDTPQPLVRLVATHPFSRPSTYFHVLRATFAALWRPSDRLRTDSQHRSRAGGRQKNY